MRGRSLAMLPEETDISVVRYGVKLLSVTWESDGVSSIGRISWDAGDRMTSVPISWDDLRKIGDRGLISYEGGGGLRAELDADGRERVAWIVAFIASAIAASSKMGYRGFRQTWTF